ncbi:MAG: hypothetical protein ACK4FV_06035 [Candidatus Nitrosocaldus sp.]
MLLMYSKKGQYALYLSAITLIITLLYCINNIQSYIIGSCELYAEIKVSPLYYNGSIRQNPDGTYYAGDAFAYNVYHGYNNVTDGSSCIDYSYRLEVDGDAIIYGTDTSGVVEISADARIGIHTLRFQQSIIHVICSPIGEDIICAKFRYSKSTTHKFTVKDPMFEAHLSKNQLIDDDGFVAINKDGTYYIGDPIAILHKVNYGFKNERIGSLHVIVEREYGGMMPVYEYNCSKELCNHKLIYDKYTSTLDLVYGDGITIYNTNNSSLGTHTVLYTLKLINIDKVIATVHTSIGITLVKYMPVYHYYIYLVLNDDMPWSYNKSIAVALHYHGSMDSDGNIYPMRRSKINHYEYNVNTINKEILIEHPRVVHVDAHNFNAERSTLIFEHEDYGKIVFSPLIEDDDNIKLLLSMIKLNIKLYSTNFAGYDRLEVISADYVYPLVKFSTILDVIVYGSDGSIKDIPVEVELQPVGNLLHDYIMKKVINDSNHEKFAEMVLDDMYARDNYANGIGRVSINIRYTSYHIPPYVLSNYDLLDIPLHIALDTLTPYRVKITVGDVTKVYNEHTFSFYRNYIVIINMDQDNKIEDITLTHGKLIFSMDEKFGVISRIVIDGVYYDPKKYCSDTCIIPFHGNSAKVEVYNDWGGRAYTEVIKEEGNKFSYTYDMTNYILEVTFVSVLTLTLFIAYKIIVGRRRD